MSYKYFPLDEKNLILFSPLIRREVKKEETLDGELIHIGAADDKGNPAGIMTFCLYPEGIARIVYLFVKNNERRKGCAKGMISFIAPFFIRAGFNKLSLILLKEREGQFEEDLYGFVQSFNGVSFPITDHIVSVPAGGLLKKLHVKKGSSLPISAVHPLIFREAFINMDQDVLRRLDHFHGIFDDSSSCIMDGNRIRDMLLFIPREDKKGVVLIYMTGKDGGSLAEMLDLSVKRIISAYGEDALVTFATLNNIGGKMGDLFFGSGTYIGAERFVIDL